MKSCALQTGISDHHKMIMSVSRCTFAKGKPKTLVYRCYRSFEKNTFEQELSRKLGESDLTFDNFANVFNDTLNHYAPIRKKKTLYNNQTFMNKALRKAIMIRPRRRNSFNMNLSNWEKYKKQRSFCVKLLRQNKKIISTILMSKI